VEDRVKRSVDALQRLYTIVVGLALTEGARRVIDPNLASATARAAPDIPPEVPWMLFGALVITVVPFYHGANRHLDDSYVFESASKRASLIFDFFMLFIEGILFVLMAMTTLAPSTFFLILLSLLGVDILWAGLSLLTKGPSAALWSWCAVNMATIVLLVLFLYSPVLREDIRIPMLLIIVIIRTIVDYRLSYDFYMGTKSVPVA
jgi:hypothetical protein